MTEDGTQSLKSIVPIMEGTVSEIKGGQGCYSNYGDQQMSLIQKNRTLLPKRGEL